MTTHKAIYPGTFDPITHGHLDIITRASNIFSELVVAVSGSTSKATMFSLSERMALVEASTTHLPNVSVKGFDGLLVDFAIQQNARVLLRGLRTMRDFEYDMQLASANRHLSSVMETVFLPSVEAYLFISSSLVREVAVLGGDVSAFAPPPVVLACLKMKGKSSL